MWTCKYKDLKVITSETLFKKAKIRFGIEFDTTITCIETLKL